MEIYLSFVAMATFCLAISIIILGLIITVDKDGKRPLFGKIVTIFCILVIIALNGYINYVNSLSLQKSTIKRCYYNGVSVKINKTFKTDSNGNLIENKIDSVFYINEARE